MMPGMIPPVMHGPECPCNVCRPPRNQDIELRSTTDRIRHLEQELYNLKYVITEIKKGNNHMGYALWCQKGQHSFDENDPQAERMTVDKRDDNGKKTGEEMTVHMCGRHAQQAFAPIKKSLREITAEINEVEDIGE